MNSRVKNIKTFKNEYRYGISEVEYTVLPIPRGRVYHEVIDMSEQNDMKNVMSSVPEIDKIVIQKTKE